MKRLFISPHDDDQALFGAFTCMRYRPDVIVVLDSYIQPQRGEKNCDVENRAKETENANRILGCKTLRVGLHDDIVSEEDIEKAFSELDFREYDLVYAPALQGGNIHHDMVHRAAYKVFGNKVVEYTTYTKTELHTVGQTEIRPNSTEQQIKQLALDCYKSQIVINKPHFDAVLGKSEYLNWNRLTKCFVLTQFGEPHSWTQEFIDHVQHLERYGWYWKIFTPNKLESKGNVEIVPMTTDQFNDLVETKLGIRPNMFMTEKGVPSVHVTDFYVFTGLIFEDYLRGFDYWGITNIDIVYGRLDKFIPDYSLNQCDVWSDDVNAINGIFSLFRNRPDINNLCKEIPDWKMKLSQKPCEKCLGNGVNHSLFGTDEYDMTEVMKKAAIEQRVIYGYPSYYPIHSYDRLEQHVPEVKLEIKPEGSLWELMTDTNPPEWIHGYKHFGREIPYFHFIRTKEWPKSLKK